MARKNPAFAGRAFLFCVIYADIIDEAYKKEKHGRTVSSSRNRAGAEAAATGIRGGYCAWIEKASGCKPANNKKPERCGLGRCRALADAKIRQTYRVEAAFLAASYPNCWRESGDGTWLFAFGATKVNN
ncbi:hypothetical protein [Hymenobacter sp. B1770]|uniref:hypothetical protein n=1 Tax=Hymenobacter sp. B1770 TaxID=1718788 RepID=UPI003CEF59C5